MENTKPDYTEQTDFSIFTSPYQNRVGFGLRLAAYIIDNIFVLALGYTVSLLAPQFIESIMDYTQLNMLEGNPMYNFVETMTKISMGAIFAGLLYNLVEAFAGYTLGKFIIGIQIANSDSTFATPNSLIIRYLIKNISTIFSLIAIVPALLFFSKVGSLLGLIITVGCFFVLGEKRQAFHDMIAKTAVFKRIDIKNN